MKARLSPVAIALTVFLLFFVPVHAQIPTAGQVRSSANLRGGPGTTYAIVGHADPGTSVQIAGCNDDCTWYHLADGNWIAAFLVDATSTAPTIDDTAIPTAIPSAAPAATCPAATVAANIRSGPGTTFDIVGSATPGACIDVTGRTEAGDWLQLSDGNWIFAELVSNAGTPSVVGDTTRTEVIQIATAEPIVATPEPTAIPTAIPTETPTPQPTVVVEPSCDPNYAGACIPIVSGDLNCPDVGVKDFSVVGNDHHRFDRDHDGIACES